MIDRVNVKNNFGTEYLLVEVVTEDVESIDDLSVSIERSTNKGSGYVLVGELNTPPFEIKDKDVNLTVNNVEFFYRATLKDSNGEKIDTKIGHVKQRKPDTLAGAITHKHKVILDVIDNDDVVLLSKKRYGERCSKCWDPIRKQPSRSYCSNCYNTGYSGGFYPPEPIKISYMNSPSESRSVERDGTSGSDSPINAWTLNYPLIYPGDIIVDLDNNRFRISQVNKTTKNNTHILRHVMSMTRIPKSDIIYKIPVSEGDFNE